MHDNRGRHRVVGPTVPADAVRPKEPGPMTTYAPPPAKRKRAVPLFVAVLMTLVALLAGGLIGAGIGAAGTGTPVAAASSPTPGASVAKLAAKPATTKPAAKPAATIADGVWTVGDDVPAGTYKVTAAVSDGCYWKITTTGDTSDIVDNDAPAGGLPRVTLKRGQDFQTKRCGTWRKQ